MTDLNLAPIGNCRIAALIDGRGRIAWSCLPRLDGDPVFCSLLDTDDDRGGFCDVTMPGGRVAARQSYDGNTAILTTVLEDGEGSVRITDFAPRFKQFGRVFRPAMIVRRIEPVAGKPRIAIRMRPRFDYGATRPRHVLGSNHIRYHGAATDLRLTTDAPLSYIEEERPFRLDAPIHLIIGPDEGLDAPIAETAERFLAETRDYWQEWSRYLSVPFEWQDVVIRSAITLKLCSYEETGGIIAAMTTSLPEHHNSGRTWDYRFCWLRDAYFTVHALNRLGATRTMEDYIRYIANVAALDPDGRLNPLYGIVPGTPLDEKSMPALGGYRGNQPVRVGNGAATQIQNDGYGSVVLAAAQMFFDRRLPRQGDRALFELLESVGEKAVKYAFEPDAGLWEYRGSTSVRTYTVVMCWAACDRLMKIARVLELPERAAYWREHAQSLRRAILEQGWNSQRNSFVESFGGSHVDASLLLLHEVGFVAANDPRFVGTVKAIEEELLRGKLLFRYAIPDDFGVPETAFLTCTFWYVDALHAMGRKEEARAIFEHLLSLRNPAGLLSEDVSLGDKPELWGNIPQTYCMVGLIVSAMRLSKGWEEAFWRG